MRWRPAWARNGTPAFRPRRLQVPSTPSGAPFDLEVVPRDDVVRHDDDPSPIAATGTRAVRRRIGNGRRAVPTVVFASHLYARFGKMRIGRLRCGVFEHDRPPLQHHGLKL